MLKVKLSKCKVCGEPYVKRSMAHVACGPRCAVEWLRMDKEKKLSKEIKRRKEALKTRSDYLKEAQAEFNKFIRTRDELLPCISCGKFHKGSWDAGHYRSVGAAPQLRFDEANCHRQCVPCNQHKSGNAIEYRKGLISRVGVDEVERIENDSAVARWSVEDIKAIKAKYKLKLKELINSRKEVA